MANDVLTIGEVRFTTAKSRQGESATADNGGASPIQNQSNGMVANGTVVPTGMFEKLKQQLPQLLRRLGVLLLVASALAFIGQRWMADNAIIRLYEFLGYTVLLALAGLACGTLMSDSRGARTFLALAVAFVPATFGHLGALVHTIVQSTPPDSPYIAEYLADSRLIIAIVTGVSLFFLIPVIYSAFSVLSRSQVRSLTLLYLFANLLLVLPVRDPNLVGMLALNLFSVLTLSRLLRKGDELSRITFEGRTAEAVLYLPLLLLLGRGVFHPTSAVFLSAVTTMLGYFSFFGTKELTIRKDIVQIMQTFGSLIFIISWVLFAHGICFESPASLLYHQQQLAVPIFCLPSALILIALSFACGTEGVTYRRIAGAVSTGSMVYQLILVGGISSSFLLVVVAMLTLIYSFILEEKGLFYAGAAGLGVGLIYQLRYATQLITPHPWISLAVVGIGIVFASSYVESNFARLTERVTNFRRRLESWS